MNSMFLRLAKNDLVKGAMVAAGGAIIGVILPAIEAGTIIDISVLKGAATLGIGAGLSYLTKNLFTNSDGKIGREIVSDEEFMKAMKLLKRPKEEDPNGITGA